MEFKATFGSFSWETSSFEDTLVVFFFLMFKGSWKVSYGTSCRVSTHVYFRSLNFLRLDLLDDNE